MTALGRARLFWLLLRTTRTGRNIYAFGNPDAGRSAGISRTHVELLAYTLSSAVAGLCGCPWTERFTIAYTQAAEGREFAIIAACVIGRASIAGGRGTVPDAALGALFIVTLSLYRGIAVAIVGDGAYTAFPPGFARFGRHCVGDVLPVEFVIYVVASLVFAIILQTTVYGRRIYAMGKNPDAPRLCRHPGSALPGSCAGLPRSGCPAGGTANGSTS